MRVCTEEVMMRRRMGRGGQVLWVGVHRSQHHNKYEKRSILIGIQRLDCLVPVNAKCCFTIAFLLN